MRLAKYLEWENIMLDTTAILAYLQAMREGNVDTRCTFVKRLIDDLNINKSTQGKVRNFYVSAITISELYNKSTDTSKTARIVSQMNIANMTFVSFDTDIAEHMTNSYHALLGTDKQNKISRDLNLPESELNLCREWITKDLMIIGTSDYLKCDTVITLDERTFEPLCKLANVPCCVAKSVNFNLNEVYIFEYEKKQQND